MNILWITPELPFPITNGHRYYYGNTIKRMTELGNNIYLCTFIDDDAELQEESYRFLNSCTAYHLYKRAKQKDIPVFTKYPSYVAKRVVDGLQVTIQNYISHQIIDTIIIESTGLACYLPEIYNDNVVRVVTVHNIDYKLLYRAGKAADNYRDKYILFSEALKSFFYERAIYKNNNYELLTFVSEREKEQIENTYNINNAYHSPIGVSSVSSPNNSECNIQPVMAFIGNLNYVCNKQSIMWFINEVLPLIEKEKLSFKLIIAGANPDKDIINATSNKLNVDLVPNFNCIETILSSVDIVIAPIVSGAGVKVKILEALASKKLVITTELGQEGTTLINNKHFVVVNNCDAVGFSKECIKALSELSSYKNIAECGYHYVKDNYNWDVVVKNYNDLLWKYHERGVNLEYNPKV